MYYCNYSTHLNKGWYLQYKDIEMNYNNTWSIWVGSKLSVQKNTAPEGAAYFESRYRTPARNNAERRKMNLVSSQMHPAAAEHNNKNHLHEVKPTNISGF